MSAEPDHMRALWQRQAGEPMLLTGEELRHKARSFEWSIRWRNLREYAAAGLIIVLFALRTIWPGPAVERAGSLLVVLGALYVSVRLRRSGSAATVPTFAETRAMLDAHRRSLERQRDLLADVWRWYLLPLVPGLSLLIVGRAREHALGALVYALICVLAFAGIARLNRAAARRLQREIDLLGAGD